MSSDGDGILSPALECSGDDIEASTKGDVGITWQNRPGQSKLQWFCLFIYFAIGGLFLVQGTLAVTKQNMKVSHPGQACASGWWQRRESSFFSTSHWCMAPELKETWDACQAKLAPLNTALGDAERKEEEQQRQDEE